MMVFELAMIKQNQSQPWWNFELSSYVLQLIPYWKNKIWFIRLHVCVISIYNVMLLFIVYTFLDSINLQCTGSAVNVVREGRNVSFIFSSEVRISGDVKISICEAGFSKKVSSSSTRYVFLYVCSLYIHHSTKHFDTPVRSYDIFSYNISFD